MDSKFVFVNENNEEFIDKECIESYPIVSRNIHFATGGDSVLRVGILFDECTYDTIINKNIWTTIVCGFDNVSEHETYVLFENNDIDTILVHYSFTTDCIGRDYCANIDEAYYNGKLIYSDKNLNPDFIYITKTENKTSIEFE